MQTSEPNPNLRLTDRAMLAAGTAAIFSGAFLLFQVQPIMARFILPAFGGSPDVWTTCMLFFQVLLLAGYAWAHLLVTYVPPPSPCPSSPPPVRPLPVTRWSEYS
jgi:hypothetical protein